MNLFLKKFNRYSLPTSKFLLLRKGMIAVVAILIIGAQNFVYSYSLDIYSLRIPLLFEQRNKITKTGKEGFETMRRMIFEKLQQLAQEKNDRPLLVLIFGRPGTSKSTVLRYVELLRFGLNEDEVVVFEHDSQHSMVYYNLKTSKAYNPNLKLILVEGYNTVPYWADKNNPDLVVEFIASYNTRLQSILSRGWSKPHTKRLVEAPRITYNADLIIDTSNFDIGSTIEILNSFYALQKSL